MIGCVNRTHRIQSSTSQKRHVVNHFRQEGSQHHLSMPEEAAVNYIASFYLHVPGRCVCVCVCSGLAVESHLQSGRVQTAGRARLPPPTPPCLLLLASVSHLPLPERGWCWYLKLGAGRSALSSPSLSLPWYGYSTVPRRSHDDDEHHHHHHRAHAHAHHHQPHHHHHHHHHHHYNRHHHHHYHYHQQEPWLQLPAPPRPPTDEERM